MGGLLGDERGANRVFFCFILVSNVIFVSFHSMIVLNNYIIFVQCLDTEKMFLLGTGCLSLFQSLFSVYLAWKLWAIRDQFSIASELRLMMLATFLLAVVVGTVSCMYPYITSDEILSDVQFARVVSLS